jgi:hypothetical protein
MKPQDASIKKVEILTWKCYDPECRLFAFQSLAGTFFAVPLSEMERITDFLRSHSKKTPK